MAEVSLHRVTKSFGPAEVIHGISIAIADGEFVVLVGPSGCGKSTLLRMIAGLEEVTGGEIRIGGRLVNDTPPKDRDVAMVFQNYALYPHMTVAQNMGFSLRLRGERREVIDRKVGAAAALLGLEDLLDRRPRQLSGGQRQRVAMGRSIVRAPQVFLFDEPLSNLDARLRVQVRAEIKDLHQRLRTTTVYVTHDQIEAMTMADRIVALREGVVEQIGAPLDLYDRPANLFVAGFIGSPAMNVIEGEVASEAGAALFRAAGGIHLPLPDGLTLERGRRVCYGVRPEHVGIGETGLEAEVVLVEPTGSETQVVVRVGNQQLMSISRERLRLGRGDRVRLAIDTRAIHLFDRQTTERITG